MAQWGGLRDAPGKIDALIDDKRTLAGDLLEGGAETLLTEMGEVVASVAGAQAVTGRQVARLRRKLDLSQRELGLLLGVSGVTVENWERRPGPLPLQARTRQVWEGAAQLTREEAWMWLEVLAE